MSNPLIKLTDYQREKVMDRSRFRFDLWARQTGKSFSTTLADTLTAAEGEPWVVLSSGERGSKENIEKCQMHAQAIGVAIENLQSDFKTDDGTFTAHEIRFPSGGRIVGLPANPATARGHSANVDLDEFSTHKDSRKIWTALFPTINRGYRLRVNGTPLGKQNKFYELYRDWSEFVAGGKAGYAVKKVTIYDAVGGGLVLQGPDGEPCTPEELREALGDPDAWAQEYLCEFVDEATAYLTYEMIAACEDENASVAAILKEISGPLYVGVDIGRKRDLTVIWVAERVGDVSWTRAVITLEKAMFRDQKEELFKVLELPNLRRACIDATGIGMQMAEEAQQRFGSYRVEAVTFTNLVKEDLAVRVRGRFEDRLCRIPAERAIRDDLHSIKKYVTAAGNVRFDAERTENGHCYDADTELLTACGWKKFADLTTEDKVASLRDGALIFEPPIEIQRLAYNGEMIRLKNKQVDLLVTPNHRLYVRLPGAERFGFVEAKTLVGSTAPIEFLKSATWNGETRQGSLVAGELIPTESWLRFIGAFLAHGFTSTRNRIGVYAMDRIGLKTILDPLPWKFWQEGKKCPSRRIKNRALWKHLSPLGRQWERFIPREILQLAPKQLSHLLDGLMWGQGHKSTSWSFTTTSRRLADDIQELVLRLGMAGSVTIWTPSIQGLNKRTMYNVNINRTRLTPQINKRRKSVSVEKYSGSVHCCTVPSGLLYVRRNGVAVWCGNSDRFWALALAEMAASGPVSRPSYERVAVHGAGFGAGAW